MQWKHKFCDHYKNVLQSAHIMGEKRDKNLQEHFWKFHMLNPYLSASHNCSGCHLDFFQKKFQIK